MARRNFLTIKGITVHYDKDIFGQYFLAGHYTTKQAPDSKVARAKFFKPYIKNLKKLDRNNKKYKTLTALKMDLKRSLI